MILLDSEWETDEDVFLESIPHFMAWKNDYSDDIVEFILRSTGSHYIALEARNLAQRNWARREDLVNALVGCIVSVFLDPEAEFDEPQG